MLLVAAGARVGIASILGIFSAKYRTVASIYARVMWSIIVNNPMLERRGSSRPPAVL
jgi:hypothetical protein